MQWEKYVAWLKRKSCRMTQFVDLFNISKNIPHAKGKKTSTEGDVAFVDHYDECINTYTAMWLIRIDKKKINGKIHPVQSK